MPAWISQSLGPANGQMSDLFRFCLTRGLCPSPKLPERPSEAFDTFQWHISPSGDIPNGCRVFTDGSLIDGQWAGCAALGWAIVVLDSKDSVVAAAYGVPPQWVDSIQGAELWAVQIALATIVFPKAILTDCKTVQTGVRQTGQWIKSSKR
eukprot:10940239-Karenia_brevis.AAC.1